MCYGEVVNVGEWNMAETHWMTALDFYRRREEITEYYSVKEDYFRMLRGYNDINFRLTVVPSQNLTTKGVIPVYATTEDIRKEMW